MDGNEVKLEVLVVRHMSKTHYPLDKQTRHAFYISMCI